MRQSAEVRDTLLRFYEVFSAADLEGLAQILAREEEGVMVIGTAPGDWTEGREQWIAAREALMHAMEGVRLEAGEEPYCYEEGSMGWVVDQPRAVLPEGTISTRLTGVMHQEDGQWKVDHPPDAAASRNPAPIFEIACRRVRTAMCRSCGRGRIVLSAESSTRSGHGNPGSLLMLYGVF